MGRGQRHLQGGGDRERHGVKEGQQLFRLCPRPVFCKTSIVSEAWPSMRAESQVPQPPPNTDAAMADSFGESRPPNKRRQQSTQGAAHSLISSHMMNAVMVEHEHVVEAVATFIAHFVASHPEVRLFPGFLGPTMNPPPPLLSPLPFILQLCCHPYLPPGAAGNAHAAQAAAEGGVKRPP